MFKKKNIIIGIYPLVWRVSAGGGFLIERRDGTYRLLCETMEGTEVTATRSTNIKEDTFKALRKEAKGHWLMMKDIVKKGEVKP